MRILLIDDDKSLCHLTKIILTKHGYDVAVFNDANSGIKHAQLDKPNLILMDIMMPGLGGQEAVQILKSNPQLKDVPVVFLTGLVSDQERDLQDPDFNVNGLKYRTLGKPYEIDKLLEVVRKYAE